MTAGPRKGGRDGKPATDEGGVVLVARFDLRRADLDAFETYEAAVLALLPEYGGRLMHRLRSIAHDTEFHVVSFDDASGHSGYLADPRRAALAEVFRASGARAEVVRCAPVEAPDGPDRVTAPTNQPSSARSLHEAGSPRTPRRFCRDPVRPSGSCSPGKDS